MKLYKQVRKGAPNYKTAAWWCDFSVNGQRFRISTDTSNKTDALKFAKDKEAAALQGKLSASSANFARLTFIEAADKYLASRKLELQPSSLKKEKQLLVQIKAYFGPTRLNRISAEMILNYREQRAASCGPASLNMETGVLRRVLRRAKLWHSIADDIRPLKEPESIGRALSPDEKTALLEAAASKPEWEQASLAAVIALQTAMRKCEVRNLQWSDIDLLTDTLTIRKSKTHAGLRQIPLSPVAVETFVQLRARAERFGGTLPQHYVFPAFMLRGSFNGTTKLENRVSEFNPLKPVGSWRTAWRKLTKQAGLAGLRFHDLRHTLCTELDEYGVPESVISAVAGWERGTQRMLRVYSHVRLETIRRALEPFWQRQASANVFTMNAPGTNEHIEHVNTLNG
jgi:integrase